MPPQTALAAPPQVPGVRSAVRSAPAAAPGAGPSSRPAARRAVAPRPAAVNAAFLQEIHTDDVPLRRLLRAVEEFSQAPPVAMASAPPPAQLFAELCDRVARHFALEETYGYVEGIAPRPSRLGAAAAALRADHARLLEQARRLAALAQACVAHWPQGQLAARLRRRTLAFLVCWKTHERGERRLIAESLGGGVVAGD